ncbi:MAG TPA: MFS transporter, partial [Thermomicrobiales bacterium]|nr:MFS transporter [Thermomicrobiales bacterium]
MSSVIDEIVGDESVLLTEEITPEAELAEEPAPRRGAFSALEVPAFARYWTTLCLSMTGTWVRITAMGVLVYDITGDPFKLGLISFVQAAPELIVGPIAGAYLDRVDRRKVLIGLNLIFISMMVLVATLVKTGAVQYWHLIIVALVIGTATGFDWPARLALAPTLVDRSRLQSAVAINSAAFNGARVLGPTIGGWLIGVAGLAFCFGFTAIAALPFTLILLTLTAIRRPTSIHATDPGASPFTTLIEGYRYIWRTPKIRGLLSVDIVPIALGMSYATMAPAIAKDVLHLPDGGLGWLLAANGVGSLTGTIAVAFLSGVQHRGRIVIGGIAAFGVMLVVFGLSGSLWISLPAMLLLGLVFATYGTMNDTLVQTNIDETYRGRIVAVQTMLWGLTPIGGLLAGFLAGVFNVQWAVAINGMLVLCYVPYLWFRTPVR